MKLTAELISTGAELLSGRTLNRHAQVLGSILGRMGIQLLRDTTVMDDEQAISEAVQGSVERADIVLVTGGLGPTNDDLTREAVAQALGRSIHNDAETLKQVESFIRRNGRPMLENHKKQADLVSGAVALMNPVGIAPGQRIELDNDKILFLLPGPPREFLGVLETQVIPWIQDHYSDLPVPLENIFVTCGIGESDIVQRVEEHDILPEGVDIAYCAAPGRVEVRLTTESNPIGLLQAADKLRTLISNNIFSEDRRALEQIIGQMLMEKGQTLATAESCTGGSLGARITAVPGSSAYFRGGVISYANGVKEKLLGVPAEKLDSDGAVSESVARQMAMGARVGCGADLAVSITGIAGPGGGSPEKPVGLIYIGLASAKGCEVVRCSFRGDRGTIRERSVQKAMELIWRALKDS